MTTDPIADLLTRLRNASRANITTFSIPHSKMKETILKICQDKGFIEKFEKMDSPIPEILISLKEGRKLELKRVSKPGQRIYTKKADMKPFRKGLGIRIVSTSKGVMTSEEANKQNTGGEILCEIY